MDMTLVHEPAPVKLPLSPSELWTVHYVLCDRIESARRSLAAPEPPPTEVFHALEKIEAGHSWFTPVELRYIRAELKRYLNRSPATRRDRTVIERIIDRIAYALAGWRRTRPPLSSDRRMRPR